MPRTMTPAMLAAFQSNAIQPAIFMQAQFSSGPVYLWTGYGSIVWNSQTWVGIGNLGTISSVEEGTGVEAKGVTLTFGGFDSAMLIHVLNEFVLGAPVSVWLALFAGGAIIPSPIIAWAGRMDQPTIDVNGQTASISINCENRLVDMNNSVSRRYTNDDQQLDYPGDRGFEFVNAMQEVTIYWGAVPNSTNNR